MCFLPYIGEKRRLLSLRLVNLLNYLRLGIGRVHINTHFFSSLYELLLRH